MKFKGLVIAISLAGVASTHGAIYNVTTGISPSSSGIAPTGLTSDLLGPPISGPVTNGYQSPLNPGVVGIGVFSSLTDAAITTIGQVPNGKSLLINNFQVFGSVGSFTTAGASGLRGVFVRNTSATVTGSIFSNRNIYIVVGSGTTFENSLEFLVLKNNTLFADLQDMVPTPLTVTISAANTTLLFGRHITDVRTTTADSSATPGWGTAVIPEPSAILFFSLGAIGLTRRRRSA